MRRLSWTIPVIGAALAGAITLGLIGSPVRAQEAPEKAGLLLAR